MTAEEGIFHITSNPKGFFVNRSTRYLFDPRPAVNPHFSHELFVTLLGASASLRASWQNICLHSQREGESEDGYEQSSAGGRPVGALDVVSALYSQARCIV
jgi:hypothetical protein